MLIAASSVNASVSISISQNATSLLVSLDTLKHLASATLSAKIRAQFEIQTGTKLHFELRGQEMMSKAAPPMRAYCGLLKGYNLDVADFEIPKEPDREFE